MQEMRQRIGGALGRDLAGVQRLGASVAKRNRGVKGRFPAPQTFLFGALRASRLRHTDNKVKRAVTQKDLVQPMLAAASHTPPS